MHEESAMLVKNSAKTLKNILQYREQYASRMELLEKDQIMTLPFFPSTRLSRADKCEQEGEADKFYWIDTKLDSKSHESSIENSIGKEDTCRFSSWLPHRNMPLPQIQEESEQDILEMD